jgi:hypothetical protein
MFTVITRTGAQRAVAIAAVALLAGCSEDEALGVGPDDNVGEAAINEIVTTAPLNASSADTMVYFSFAKGTLVPRTAEWDLALRRFEVRLNSPAIAGTSSRNILGFAFDNNSAATDAEVLAYTPASQLAAFDAIRLAQIPADNEFVADRLTENSQGYLSFAGIPHAQTGLYWKARLADGTFAVFRITALNFTQTFEVASLVIESRLQNGAALGNAQTLTVTPTSELTSISLKTNSVVTPNGCNWDLQFNSSTSELSIAPNAACNAGTYPGPSTPSFAAVTTASDAPQFATYLSELEGPIPSNVEDPDAPFRYNLAGNQRLHPTFNTYLVKSGDRVYKLQVIDYYSATGTGGFPTIRYARIK